jgi:hypothetical protein
VAATAAMSTKNIGAPASEKAGFSRMGSSFFQYLNDIILISHVN